MNDTLAIIMAGESGLEIGEVTRSRSIGAVPIGARYRTIDFILSNVVNSRIERPNHGQVHYTLQYNLKSVHPYRYRL